MFSFEYYNMVRIIPFVLDDIPIPENIIKLNKTQFWVWIILNTIAAVLWVITAFFSSLNFFSYIINFLLGLISAIYLGLSIYRIRKLTKQKEVQINTKIMIVRAYTVILTLLSLLVGLIAIYLVHDIALDFAAEIQYLFC